MKKLFLLMAVLTISFNAWAQDDYEEEPQKPQTPFILPGKGRINVENLNKNIDLDMDISQLTLSELRVLRNAFAARQGFIFMTSELRDVFNTTTWYPTKMMERFEKEETLNENNEGKYKTLPLKYTPKEQTFIKRLQQRENELVKDNFKVSGDNRVNMKNIINNYQLNNMDPALEKALGKNGFAIVPSNKLQLFHIYEKNDYHDFPSFVTTDLYLQLFHLYFDCVLRSVEEEKLCNAIADLSKDLYDKMSTLAATSKDNDIRKVAEYNQAFAAVALALINNKPLLEVSASYKDMAAHEVDASMKSENDFSEFLGYNDVQFPYSLFRPRGHYTRSETCQRYFRAMMWLQTAPFAADNLFSMQAAAMLADAVCSDAKTLKTYNTVYEPITFLMGAPDNVTILQVYDRMKTFGKPMEKLLTDRKKMKALSEDIKKLALSQIRIRPKFEKTSPYKINFMPQRYQPDAEVLNELIDAESRVTKRGAPMGLDIFAAMGNNAAEDILVNELHQDKQWDKYMPTLQKMKTRMGEINWQETVATRWMEALTTMSTSQDSRFPYFMQTPQWEKKELNASLASWAELKHDAILYAKQPMAAECGDYGPPAPTTKGYVEPNVAYWTKAIELLDATEQLLKKYDLVTEKVETTTSSLREQAVFLCEVSKKELQGKTLTDEEYTSLEIIGASFENISLDLVRSDDQSLMGWDNVEGADKSISVIADVYTANGDNNPKACVLYEGVGPAYEIYVVVPIGQYLYLMRGAVLSYREFDRPIEEQRLTDEEWQEMLKQYPTRGIPEWMKEITVPLKAEPEDNEEVFYSSGC